MACRVSCDDLNLGFAHLGDALSKPEWVRSQAVETSAYVLAHGKSLFERNAVEVCCFHLTERFADAPTCRRGAARYARTLAAKVPPITCVAAILARNGGLGRGAWRPGRDCARYGPIISADN